MLFAYWIPGLYENYMKWPWALSLMPNFFATNEVMRLPK